MESGGLDGDFEGSIGAYCHEGRWFFNPEPGNALALDKFEPHSCRCLGFGRGAGEFGVALAGVDVAEVEEGAFVKNGKVEFVAGCGVADVKVAAPFTLAIKAGRDFAVGGDSEVSPRKA